MVNRFAEQTSGIYEEHSSNGSFEEELQFLINRSIRSFRVLASACLIGGVVAVVTAVMQPMGPFDAHAQFTFFISGFLLIIAGTLFWYYAPQAIQLLVSKGTVELLIR